MNADFQLLREFSFNTSTPYLWVFKDSDRDIRFVANYVQTDGDLNNEIISFVNNEMTRITECSPYSHISQNNENSCLDLNKNSTNFPLLQTQVDRLETENRIEGAAALKGSKGYVVKFVDNGTTVYAVRRSTSTFKTAYRKKFINIIFRDGELSGIQDNSFSIEKRFDFYVINDNIFIANKNGFEAAIKHRTQYVQAFLQLQQSTDFRSLFTDMNPITNYIGNNSIQLRRMSVVQARSIYTNPSFILNLQRVNTSENWGINFDPVSNKIIPCPDTMRTILTVLLDHLLMSRVTNNNYEVPDSIQV